jgi:hypothetical protein
MAAVVGHRAKRRSEWASVGSVVLCGERHRDDRRTATGSVLAGVEAIALQSVGHERFVGLRVHSPHSTLRVQPVGSLWHERHSVGVVAPATLASAAARRSGNFFFRFSARRSIPAQAFALKKYRCGTAPVSKMSHNEDATASLGHSEELSVQHSPGATIPEFRQRPDDGSNVPSSVRGQNAGDIFPDDPPRPQSASKAAKLDGQVATRIIQTAASSGDGEGLAGSSSGQNVNWTAGVLDRGEVAKVLNVGVAMRQ